MTTSRFATAADYRGKVVILYFGYTHCPDECPTTLANLASVLATIWASRRPPDVRVLFVSVDPDRDTEAGHRSSRSYVQVNVFAPQIDGLRGSAGRRGHARATLSRRLSA